MINLVEKLIKIPSYTGNNSAVEECFSVCKNYMDDVEIIIREIRQNGYISALFSNCNTLDLDILSICHMDVVEANEYKMIKMNDKIFGRGVFDMKSFTVSALTNLKKTVQENIDVKYGVLITSDEEIGGENGTKYWIENFGLQSKIILDSDCGNDINHIASKNLGAITIKIIGGKYNIKSSIYRIKSTFNKFYCEDFDNEIDMNFDEKNITALLKNCMCGDSYFNILMFNDVINYDINSKYHKLYRNILNNNGIYAKYITINATNDARYFSYISKNKPIIISHQSTGGNNHKNNEWLNIEDFHKYNKIQMEFIKKYTL